ncbi:hypothetical protein K3495_g4806 [Podosphaera aphanis]|nr:hypothetical protein K3495_g4806 [Podosphaera aphanis]
MSPTHRSRRMNPLTVIIGAVFFMLILLFLLSSSSAGKAAFKFRAASNSFPSSTIRKQGQGAKWQPPPVVHYQMNNVTPSSDPIANKELILILTPMGRYYKGFWENLMRLSYPHELITLGFIIPKDREGNLAMAALQELVKKTQKSGPVKDRFRNIIIERQTFKAPIVPQVDLERQNMEVHKTRRISASKARNSLLFTTLNPTISWVLWLNADIIDTPPSLVQDLASHDKEIIAPNPFLKYTDPKTNKISEHPYDLNSWQESLAAQNLAEKMGPDDVLLEGFPTMLTHRKLIANMATENGDPNLEVELDGVGGSVLLVKAEVHRDGAMFPPFAFYHLIETEGFVKMAKRLGWKATGLPNYKVYHYNR